MMNMICLNLEHIYVMENTEILLYDDPFFFIFLVWIKVEQPDVQKNGPK